jgi:superfamily II DNA or RNA helicase
VTGESPQNLVPREWQETALSRWNEKKHGIVEVVTGGGKTIFAFLCIDAFWREHPDGIVVILVPTNALADQWYVGVQEDLGCRPENIAVFSGTERPKNTARIKIAVLNTARRLSAELHAEKPSFLIVDECHRAATPVNSQALQGDYVAALGLSATPTREYDDGFERYLVPALGPVIFRYTYEDAFRDEVISPFSLVNVRVALLPSEAESIHKLTRRIHRAFYGFQRTGDDSTLKRLLQRRAAISSSAAMRIPVAVRLIEEHRGERAIVFHESISAAEQIAKLLQARKHSVTIYHSRSAPNVRRDNLRLYRRGIFDVLVSCRALDEGMNVPETAVAVVASSTASGRQRVQRLGRVLRPAQGKDRAIVYTLYATEMEEQRLVKEATTLSQIASVEWKHSHIRRNG